MTGQERDCRADVEELLGLARRKRREMLEVAWIAAIERDAVELGDLLSVVQIVSGQKDTEQAEMLIWFLLTAWAERKGPAEALEAAKQALTFLPESDTLREELASLYRKVHGALPEIEALTEMTVLCRDIPLAAAVQRMEQFLSLIPGTYVEDKGRQVSGRVASWDTAEGVLRVSFADGERAYDLSLVDCLERLEEDDFRALGVCDRTRLEGLAQDDPTELVRLVLKAFGPRLTFGTLKKRLAGIVPEASWSKWWSHAKPQIRRAAMIGLSEGVRPTLALLARPIAYEDCLKEQFHDAPCEEQKLVMVLDYLAETEDGLDPDAGLLKHFADELTRILDGFRDAEPGIALGALAVFAEMHKKLPDAVPAPQYSLEALLDKGRGSSDLLRSTGNDKLAKCILAFIREALPERWHEVYAEVMPGCSQGICDWIARDLSKDGHSHHLAAAAAAILERSASPIGALIWLWKAACAGKFPEVLAEVDRAAVAVRLLWAADDLGRSGSQGDGKKNSLNQVRQALSTGDYSMLGSALGTTDAGQAGQIRSIVERNAGLTEDARSRILEIILRKHPALFLSTVPPWEEDVIYTTEAGLERHQDAFTHLVNVKMAENAKAIGEAAAHGDLSENAEFTAALEERDLLAKKGGRMRAELAKARVIPTDMADGASVTIGSTVKARNLSTGHMETLVFLGPWDADPDNGVYSYRAPLSQAFMGKKTDDIVVVPTNAETRSWKIVEIRANV